MTGPHTKDGGHSVNFGVSFPIEDEPPYSVDDVCDTLSAGFAGVFALIAGVCLALAGYYLTA
jgi:hypothetical protein